MPAINLLNRAEAGIAGYLENAKSEGRIDEGLFQTASKNAFANLKQWYEDPELDRIFHESLCGRTTGESPVRLGIAAAIEDERFEDIVNAFRKGASFGTGGIRGMMAFDRASIVRFKEDFNAPILRGPNTINDLVLLLTSAGVAQFGRKQRRPFERVVIGYDTRIHGFEFATVVAGLFLHYGYTVFLFDEPCPYPEVTFAIPFADIKADVGIFLSASHNDYRYNGYKLSCGNGSQFDPQERNEMYDKYIVNAKTADIRFRSFEDAAQGKLIFLGGAAPVRGFNYAGRQKHLINLHQAHADHIKSFVLMDDLARSQQTDKALNIAYCAYHGAGSKAVPRLLTDVGFREERIQRITARGLSEPNGLFPCFSSEAGKEEQPDPGDPHSADIAVEAFEEQYPGQFKNIDVLIGTDPDADRCGVTVKVPAEQRQLYDGHDYVLMPADDVWALVVWYRLMQEAGGEKRKAGEGIRAKDAEKKFIVLSHTTSEAIIKLAQKFGLGAIKTWVGFAALAAGVRDTWDQRPFPKLVDGKEKPGDEMCHPFVCDFIDMDSRRSINVAAMEQSNGFSILGGPPPDASSLGAGGHVRDKDGTFAALLTAEIAAWAKQQGLTLFELLDEKIYLDPDIGLFVTHYEPDPLIGEYPGIEGDKIKLGILQRALAAYERAKAGILTIAGLKVKHACLYRTGKYDRIYPPTGGFVFPDEGIRFFFDDARLNHLTVRPSGTGNSLRFHAQLQSPVTKANLVAEKKRLKDHVQAVVDDVREILVAPRNR